MVSMLRLTDKAQHLGTDEILPEIFALVVQAVRHALGIQTSDEQIIAGLHLLRGSIVQMNAGEGKTIAATFPAVVHAITGRSVHIITANDYLAIRDAELLTPVYQSLGISVGTISGYMEDGERKQAYQKAIIYSTMRELGFDFLRDNLRFDPEERVQGKLEVAIIDEVDHALIDEAFTPMIISGNPISDKRSITRVKNAVEEMIQLQREVARDLSEELTMPDLERGGLARILAQLLLADPENPTLREFLEKDPTWSKELQTFASQNHECLTSRLFYAIDFDERYVSLAEKGQDFLEQRLGSFYDGRSIEESLDSIWARRDLTLAERRKEADRINRRLARQYNLGNQIYQTLRAYLLLHRDVDYFITEDSVVLIDRATGRPKVDCIYQQGLQTALEAKEGVTTHPDCETLGKISVEGFIGKYKSIGGITGTAWSSADEFLQKYGLPVTVLPTTRAVNRVDLGCKVYLTRGEKLSAIVDQVDACHRTGQPVLVGTPTVERSKEISHSLSERGIVHNLLNALSCDLEAQTIKDAGNLGAVTVATNMAGRGTDIILEPDLDQGIAVRSAQLIRCLLSKEARSVLVNCYSVMEASVLEAEFAKTPLLPIKRKEHAGRVQLEVRTNEVRNPNDAPITLDFSLGLRVIGTEIHETPRIDLQLAGRSGRQGGFGITHRILSLEDNLISLHAGTVLKLGKCENVDEAGRTYFAGPKVEKHIATFQNTAEQEGKTQRSLTQDYSAVLDLHTSTYYDWRRQVMETDSQKNFCLAVALEIAARSVTRHFPQLTSEEYSAQFDCLVEEVQLDYGTDCRGLFGGDFNLLPQELGRLFIGEIERLETKLGWKEFSGLAKLILLQTADGLWSGHINEMQDRISNQVLMTTTHKSAVAHYIMHSLRTWGGFREQVMAQFLSRLLTFPAIQTQDMAIASPSETLQVNDDVRTLMAYRTPALTAAGDEQRR